MSLVDHDDVPLAKSFISQRKTEFPRPAASRAMPQPLTPPPIIARSKIRSKDAPPGVRLFILAISLSLWIKSQIKAKATEKGGTVERRIPDAVQRPSRCSAEPGPAGC